MGVERIKRGNRLGESAAGKGGMHSGLKGPSLFPPKKQPPSITGRVMLFHREKLTLTPKPSPTTFNQKTPFYSSNHHGWEK